jgi:hypothetical protein
MAWASGSQAAVSSTRCVLEGAFEKGGVFAVCVWGGVICVRGWCPGICAVQLLIGMVPLRHCK